MTFSNILDNFRSALLALIPYLESAGIEWKNSESNEDLDEVAESLFNSLIVHRLEKVIEDKFKVLPQLPKYGFNYSDYSKMSFIEVKDKSEKNEHQFIFCYLDTKEKPFDTVVCNKINTTGKVLERGLRMKYDESTFVFQLRK
jgi:hypothetical protein